MSTPEKTEKKEKPMAARSEAEKKKSAAKAKRTRARNKKKREEAARKAARTRKAGKRGGKKESRKGGRKAERRASSRKGARKSRKSRKSRKGGGGVKAVSIPRGAKKVIVAERGHRKHHRRARRNHGYAMENPLSPTEIFAGGLTMLLGLAVADISDRYWATHALTAGTPSSTGVVPYTDTPAVAAGSASTMASFGTGLYPGMLNGAAVLAPMNMTRWVSGGVLAAVPFIAAAFTKQPTLRTALQLFGFGVVARIGGKFLVDTFAGLLGSTALGQQLYVNELAATGQYQAAMGNPVTVSLPNGITPAAVGTGGATGLAKAPQPVCCSNCARGLPCTQEIPPGPAGFVNGPQQSNTGITSGSMNSPQGTIDYPIDGVTGQVYSPQGGGASGQVYSPQGGGPGTSGTFQSFPASQSGQSQTQGQAYQAATQDTTLARPPQLPPARPNPFRYDAQYTESTVTRH
jgi:hypothetical protein